MASIKDDRGYNQGFKPTLALKVRTERRAQEITNQMKQCDDSKVLEIGGGTGELAYEIAKNIKGTIISTDLCVDFIKTARKFYKLKNLSFEISDTKVLKQKYSNQKFDYIFLFY